MWWVRFAYPPYGEMVPDVVGALRLPTLQKRTTLFARKVGALCLPTLQNV